MNWRNKIPIYFRKHKAFFTLCIYGILLFTACKERDEHEGHYTDLTKKENLDSLLGELNENPNHTVISSQPTVKVTEGGGNTSIALNGIIGFDERRTNVVPARIGGRIEEIYVRYNYQFVTKGQPVLSVYSPELNTYLEQYINLFKDGNDQRMLKLTFDKLILLGLTEGQIRQMEKSGKLPRKVVFYSPYAGYVRLENSATASMNNPSSSSSSDEMAGMEAPGDQTDQNSTTGNIPLQPGVYIQEGQTLFSVNDISQVWAILSVPAESVSALKIGYPVTLQVEGFREKIQGKIDFIEPLFSVKSRFSGVRVYLDNPGKNLKINSLVSAEIKAFSADGIYVPASAVYSLGREKIVWLKTGTQHNQNIFGVRKVKTGAEANGKIQIKSGLKQGDEIAENAAYLIDSEGLIKLER